MSDDIGLFEAIHTQRALRYIAPDPIPDALVRKVIDAGIRAPNGGNQQRWRFIVINVDTAALLPLGYPMPGKHYGPTRRRPVEEVTFSETWNQPWEATQK